MNDKQQIVNEIKRFWEEIGCMNEECIQLNGNVSLSKHEAENMDEKISVDEVKKVTQHLKNCKAAEIDGVPYEMYKNGGECMYERLADLYNVVWNVYRMPGMKVKLLFSTKEATRASMI